MRIAELGIPAILSAGKDSRRDAKPGEKGIYDVS